MSPNVFIEEFWLKDFSDIFENRPKGVEKLLFEHQAGHKFDVPVCLSKTLLLEPFPAC